MASAYKINGLESLINKLKVLPKDIKSEVVANIEDTADIIVAKAIQRVPVDLGVLKQSIGNEPKNGGLNYIIYVGAQYAQYVEFGTGTTVDVPAELEDYALQFKGAGVKKVNLPARPFLFPVYFEERPKLIKKIEQGIAKYL